MLGYIAFCPHFHQPHFQLYRTREEVYRNSYLPWMELLEESARELPGFRINLHFSGPWLYWIKNEKPEYAARIRKLAADRRIGFIGGFADESFAQLSSRSDDFYYQVAAYGELLHEVAGLQCSDWQALHVVEREAGEYALLAASRAARLNGAAAIFYLDAETFYQPYFAYPGAQSDYCMEYFGVKDQYSATTCSHFPPELAMYALRDEIEGESFFTIPVHSQFRYQLLKRQPAAAGDNVRIDPAHYVYAIKEQLRKAREAAAMMQRTMPPIALIFEDAEKLGQWSHDSSGDSVWLKEFFTLVEKDSEISFTVPKEYLENCGYLDTYPVSSSRSYPEWEKWTARRGIRGLCLAEERLRKPLARLRNCEELLEAWETAILDNNSSNSSTLMLADNVRDAVRRAIMSSPERFSIIQTMMNPDDRRIYSLINRVRHLAYQEDPKWASRHPAYGAAPYFDMQALAYLELAMALGKARLASINEKSEADCSVAVYDWNRDGCDEWVLQTAGQIVIIEPCGGCIAYYYRMDPALAGCQERIEELLSCDMQKLGSYHEILKHSAVVVLTETDSELTRSFYPEGGRLERCRNSFRADICEDELYGNGGALGFDCCRFSLSETDCGPAHASITIESAIEAEYRGQLVKSIMKKTFTLDQHGITVSVRTEIKESRPRRWQLRIEAVTSASPSDEQTFRPFSYVGFNCGLDKVVRIFIDQEPESVQDDYTRQELATAGRMDSLTYVYRIAGGFGTTFDNAVAFSMPSDCNLARIVIRPAVKNYYKGLVFPAQSRMGYGNSGLRLDLYHDVINGKGSMHIQMSANFNVAAESMAFSRIVPLTGEMQGERG